MKRIAILGSTGSIGKNALRVIKALGPDYQVIGLSAKSNARLLAKQAIEFGVKFAAITDSAHKKELSECLAGHNIDILSGPESLVELAKVSEVDTIITAVVGAAGLPAVLEAAKLGKNLAIANKEPLVVAGKLLTQTASQSGASILPIDSEHSAIFQALQAGRHNEVEKIILTSSGGPFRKASMEQIKNATLADALKHPTWDMGPKITIDSATMMNKALEVIEAKWLFDMPAEKIDVLVHPESVVHSMVEFVDGSVIAQMGTPDMCLPIQYSLTYPDRLRGITSHLNLSNLGTLTFEKPDLEKFRALAIGFEVARQGGSAAVVFNAANEAAVAEFLAGRICFTRIVELIDDALQNHNVVDSMSLDELLEFDRWARAFVFEQVSK